MFADLRRTPYMVQECCPVFDQIHQSTIKVSVACSCVLFCNWPVESHVGSLWLWSTARSYFSQIPDTGLQASNCWYDI